jgi:hypothetical protein
MRWSATHGRFVVFAGLLLLAWYLSSLLETNGGWGWHDPMAISPWRGHQLAGWTALVAGAAVAGAAMWRPTRWTIFAPALIATLTYVVIRPVYLIGTPPDYFLSDQAVARWYLTASCLLQVLALGSTLIPPARRAV